MCPALHKGQRGSGREGTRPPPHREFWAAGVPLQSLHRQPVRPAPAEPPTSEVPRLRQRAGACPGSNSEAPGFDTASPLGPCTPVMAGRWGCLSGRLPSALSLPWDLRHSLGLGWMDVLQVIVHSVVQKAHDGGPGCGKAEGHRHQSVFQRQSPQTNPLAQQCTGPTLTPKSRGGGISWVGWRGEKVRDSQGWNFP